MEGVNISPTGTTMNPGVATKITQGSKSEAHVHTAHEAVSTSLVKSNEAGKSDKEVHVETHQEKEESRLNKVVAIADFLAKKAKEEGVDEAYEELASMSEEELFKDEKVPETKEEVLKKLEDVKEKEPEEEMTLEAQVVELKSRVEELSKDNEELKNKMEALTAMNKQALITAYELTLMLKKLIEEEKDEEKKRSMLDVLMSIMAKIMIAMMVGEETAEKEDTEEEEETALEQMIA